MKKIPPFKGCATAVVTPFKEDLTLDIEAFKSIVKHQLESNVSAIVVCGTTGEAPTLTRDEKYTLIATAKELCREKSIPVVAGCGSNDTKKLTENARLCTDAGADCLLCVTPYYNKCTETGLLDHFKAAAKAPLPVIVYNVPSRTGVSIPLHTYRRLSEIDNVVGVKEASGSVQYSTEILFDDEVDLHLYSGCDELNLPLMALGAKGVISVVSNILPRETQRLCSSALCGNTDTARHIAKNLNPVIKSLFAQTNPAPVKYALSLMHQCKNILRLPLTPVSKNTETAVKTNLSPFL